MTVYDLQIWSEEVWRPSVSFLKSLLVYSYESGSCPAKQVQAGYFFIDSEWDASLRQNCTFTFSPVYSLPLAFIKLTATFHPVSFVCFHQTAASNRPPSPSLFQFNTGVKNSACFDHLVQANSRNKKVFKDAVQAISAKGITNYKRGLKFAFEQLNNVSLT